LDDHDRRGRRPLAETEIIDEAAEGSQPDVEVFQLDVPAGNQAATASPRKQRWIEEVRTTVWDGREPPWEAAPEEPALRRSRGSSSRVEPVRQSVRTGSRRSGVLPVRAQDVPYEEIDDHRRRDPLLIEAPVRVKVKTVARISPDPRLWLMTRPDSLPAEQLRVLALKLREERGARVVAVTSPTRRGAGQLTAANLALAFAEGGRSRTVLLDANLRGSELSELFELSEGPGLADQIRHHRRNPGENWITLGLSTTLHFLPSGAAEKNPASLLSSEVMADLMMELRRYFDFIVLSTPPVLDSADVNILGEHVDGVLMVVRAGISRRDSLSAAINRLGESRFLGAVLVDGRR
jgi:capsular exopolysaccharide synthesis family protein